MHEFDRDSEVQTWFAQLSEPDQKCLTDVARSKPDLNAVVDYISAGGKERFTTKYLLGSGGMGEVWAVHDSLLGGTWALKKMRIKERTESKLDYLRRVLLFERERQFLTAIAHPGVPAVVDCGYTADGQRAYLMTLIDGITLDRYLYMHPRLGLTERLELILNVCSILERAHSQQIVHLDLKPDNIIVNPDNRSLYVVDWGLAARVDSDREALVVSGQAPNGLEAVGTPAWMAPEQIEGKYPARCMDVFSIGMIALAVIAQKAPRKISESLSTFGNYVHQPLDANGMTALREVPPGLKDIVLSALSKNPAHRFQSVADFRLELQHWLEFGVTKRERKTAWGWLRYQRMFAPLRFALGLTAAALMAVLLGWNSVTNYLETRHVAIEVSDIVTQVAWGNDQSMSEAIARLEFLREHHRETAGLQRALQRLRGHLSSMSVD